MKKRKLGNTGLEVTEIGFGAWQAGDECRSGRMTENDAITLVKTGYDRGINFFDTAPGYGNGKSEEILGKALKGIRDKTVINTKFGHDAEGNTDFSHIALRSSVEASLKRLQTDYIDSVILHNPPFEYLNGNSPVYEEFEKLKQEGKIRAYGSSVDSSREMSEVLNTTESRVMEVLFNIFHQETEKAFTAAQEKGVGLIIKVPLDSGWLTGKYGKKSAFTDIRKRWSEDIINRRAALLEKINFLADDSTGMVQAALRFVLAFDAVSTVIPGVKTVQQLETNISASSGVLPGEHVKRLVQFWQEELSGNPLPW
ncbi:MAG: aldo/keto reductase [Spirochaetales bacterium]|nr:aldo/keto reductase [Spirochaetales bacterium]